MSNPARLMSNPKGEGGVFYYLFPAEEDRLRKAIVSRFPHHLPELAIALNTGMRRGGTVRLHPGGRRYAITHDHGKQDQERNATDDPHERRCA